MKQKKKGDRMQIDYNKYLEINTRVIEWMIKNKTEKLPNTVRIFTEKQLMNKSQYMDMVYRVTKFKEEKKVIPATIRAEYIGEIVHTPTGQRTKELQDALGIKFTDVKTLSEAIRSVGKYEYYYNDKYPRAAALSRVKIGLNCADWSQLCFNVMVELGYKVQYVRGRFNCGGHIWLEYLEDNKWKVFDPSYFAKNKSNAYLGGFICSGTYTERQVNPGWLIKDDGIT